MSLTAMEYKTAGNAYYSKNDSLSAIESYSKAIKLVENKSDEENVSLYLLYSNRSAAYIQDKDYYSGYEDAKQSLKMKKDQNFKGFYRAAVCAYHLGFIDKSQQFIKEATSDHQQNLLDYLDLKLLIEKKIRWIRKWRKPVATAKKCLKYLQQIIQE
jgi:translocation protein SEC72